MKPFSQIRPLLLAAMFAALTAVCSQIQIPLPMVPINLALFAVFLAGALLGAKYGGLSMAVYVLLGAVGVPVFAGLTGGAGILFGQTGGYIFGYIVASVVVGLLVKAWGRSYLKLCIAMALGGLTCYAFGTVWFMAVTHMGLWTSLAYCVFPFLLGDVVKIALAALLALRLWGPLEKNGWAR